LYQIQVNSAESESTSRKIKKCSCVHATPVDEDREGPHDLHLQDMAVGGCPFLVAQAPTLDYRFLSDTF
jgi:hypothetical protein